MLKRIDQEMFAALSAAAQTAVRLRKHHNFHTSYADPSQRMLVAIEPGSYVRPHRHLATPKPEAFLVLQGRLALTTFNDDGSVREAVVLGPGEATLGVDLPAGIWHTVVCLATGTIFYETKPGPFCPTPEQDLAPWAPAEGSDQVAAYLRALVAAVKAG
jgi:cupin fold WbuC family metalloprotein